MSYGDNPGDDVQLLQIQNNKKPHQVIYLIWDKENNAFKTDGLKALFGVKEIRIAAADVLQSLNEYAFVLSFLLESMSTAEDLSLPYGYQDEFEVEGKKYKLTEEGDFRVLYSMEDET